MIKGVIFDMDGVLIDNRDAHVEAFVTYCRRYGFDCSAETLAPHFGKGNEEIIPALFPEDFINEKGIDVIAEEKEQVYRDLISEKIEPAPGLVGFLEDLRKNGIKCSVGSSGPKANVDFVLDRCNIREYFVGAVNGDMVEHAKPDPSVFLLAAELMDLAPSECVVIEDSFAGIEAARRAGSKVIAMSTTYSMEELSEADTDMLITGFPELSYETISRL